MIKICCDGCGKEFPSVGEREPELTGRRRAGMGGGGMPAGDFHLCANCGRTAFAALKSRAKQVQS